MNQPNIGFLGHIRLNHGIQTAELPPGLIQTTAFSRRVPGILIQEPIVKDDVHSLLPGNNFL
jgi:hypothetical protein